MSEQHMITLLGLIVQSDNYQSRAANADMLGNDIRTLKIQRDDLIAAMKKGADFLAADGDEWGVAALLRAAIAKAEAR